ncbi:proteasome component C11 [Cordyceps militaris]|uniref:Proteasome subunit beta n=1 Tax=Cordyceps militaris TaxID=73501 RepID=A0A2H4S9P1_CORMI|nr:proteasome component C11 [Cordyceps militaris]
MWTATGSTKHPQPKLALSAPIATTQTHATVNMEVLLGITGKDFTLIAASKAAMRGATILKASDDKTRELNKNTLLAFSGEAGDTVQFAEYIQRNAQLYSMRNETDLSPSGLAHFVRGELASSLRSRKPYNVNLLMGGVDPITGKPSLYWMDYLAAMAEVPYAAHGYAQYYCLSILDKHHHPDITLGQGIKLLTLCTDELKRRLPIDFKGMIVKAVKADGIIDIQFDDDKVVKCAAVKIKETTTPRRPVSPITFSYNGGPAEGWIPPSQDGTRASAWVM